MVYDHKVKYGGKIYRTGENVPIGEEKSSPKQPIPVDTIKETEQPTKTAINRMSTAELQNYAAAHGVEGAYDKSGGELKKTLIEMYNL